MSKNDREITKKLFNITKYKPYVFSGEIEDLDYSESAKKLPQFFIVTDKAIFSWDMIKEFWKLELKSRFDSQTKAIGYTRFFEIGKDAFSQKYRISFPYLDATHFGKSETEYNFLKQRSKLKTEYAISYDDPFDDLIINGEYIFPLLPYQFLIQFLFDKIELFSLPGYVFSGEQISKVEKELYPLHYGIFKALFHTEDNILTIKELTHILATDEIYYQGFDKHPVELKHIINELRSHDEEYKKYFDYKLKMIGSDDVFIRLKDFLDPILDHFENNRITYSETDSIEQENGLIALIYKGSEFPLKNASEYVKVRDIIAIQRTRDIAKEIFDLGQGRGIDASILPVIVYEEIDFTDKNNRAKNYLNWIKENILISYFPMKYSETHFYKFCLNFKLTPILEIDPIYGNIYREDIIKLLNQFKGKAKVGNE